MSEADDKSSNEDKKENLLQSGTNPQVVAVEPENIEEANKPKLVLPIAHQYSA